MRTGDLLVLSVLPTEGKYIGSMSVPKGLISAEDNVNPKQDPADRHLPLFIMSDVYFLEWQRQAANSPRIKRLKYSFRFHIENEATRKAIRETTGNNVRTWPGDMFDIRTTDEGKALFRTPNGVGWPIPDST
jgi:hypothetical protein